MADSAIKSKRITAIDSLRGFALLGILIMNIMSFSMPDAAYANPTVYGGQDPLNHSVYSFVHVLADQKFMALFSMLFGASVMLLFQKMKQQGKRAARVHYTRNAWLLVFGILHYVFIWQGDVLTIYALCAFFLYFFRNLKPSLQLTLGILFFLLPSVTNLMLAPQVRQLDQSNLKALTSEFAPTQAQLQEEIETFRGSYQEQINWRNGATEDEAFTPADSLLLTSFFAEAAGRAFGMMLIGMALFSMGVLSAKKSKQFYQRMATLGLSIGIPIATLGLYLYYANQWEASYALFLGRIPNHIATPFIAGGYAALIMLWCKTEAFRWLQDALANVGRMALSNYIGQSILATFIFYGYGLGLYGHLNRISQVAVVITIWIIQIIISKWWMKRFRYGPLEWLWRSITYFRLEPIMKPTT